MSEENPGASTTAGAAVSPQELRAALDAVSSAEVKHSRAKPRLLASYVERFQAGTGTVTGAFISRAASFRYEVMPTPWYIVFRDVTLLYGTFIGLPAGAGTWALWRVGTIVGWW